ncbi:MAG TPA: hypothetical protein VFE63_13950 [Roseiarcus sp.]|nr:hypothetical protein [Roseiarcus sp.]
MQSGRPLVPAAVGPPTRRRLGRRVLKGVLLALVSAGAFFALDAAPDLAKRLISVASAVRPAATPPSTEEAAPAPRAGVSTKQERESGLRGTTSAGPAAGADAPSFDSVPSAAPDGGRSKASAKAPQSPDLGPDRTESLKTKPAPAAAPPFAEEAPANESVKAPAEPGRNDRGSVRRRGTEPQAAQSANFQGLGESAKRRVIAVEETPTPPIRPEHGKRRKRERERTAKPQRSEQAEAPEPSPLPPSLLPPSLLPPSPPPAAEPEAPAAPAVPPAAQPSNSSLFRALTDSFK